MVKVKIIKEITTKDNKVLKPNDVIELEDYRADLYIKSGYAVKTER